MSASLKYYLKRAGALPPREVAKKAVRFARESILQHLAAFRERSVKTFGSGAGDNELSQHIAITANDIPAGLAAALPEIAERYIAHRFDLLGSGWVDVGYGVQCRGLESYSYPAAQPITADTAGRWLSAIVNRANARYSARAWQMISRRDYQPIDWHLDFRSGHRWNAKLRFNKQRIGFPPGSDIKLPWELSRMQHLPQLAISALAASARPDGWQRAEIYIQEIRNQIIDFYAANPPRFGPNWTCPMDVGIRAANWLVSIDIARNAGWQLDVPFQRLLIDSLHDHGHHIIGQLEWSESGRSNHYLSDIVGLLFIAAYLPPSELTDAWLAFATSELVAETERQFHGDGGNYEGSTSYHRLSGELSIFGSALIVGLAADARSAFSHFDPHYLSDIRPPVPHAPLPQFETGTTSPLSEKAVGRLHRLGQFADAVSRPDHHIPQIGDTDSGRLFKLHPVWRADGEEDLLDHRHLVAASGAMFDATAGCDWLDAAVVRALMGGRSLRAPVSPAGTSASNLVALKEATGRVKGLPEESRRVVPVLLPGLPESRSLFSFPDFGLYILKGVGFYLAFRCVENIRADAPTGHLHDDNLGIEVFAEGRSLVCDPGTYVYTSIPSFRNAYRSASAHYAPRVTGTPVCQIDANLLFQVQPRATARLIHAGIEGFAAEIVFPDGARLLRTIEIDGQTLNISDGVIGGRLQPLAPPLAFSSGYGKKSSICADPRFYGPEGACAKADAA